MEKTSHQNIDALFDLEQAAASIVAALAIFKETKDRELKGNCYGLLHQLTRIREKIVYRKGFTL